MQIKERANLAYRPQRAPPDLAEMSRVRLRGMEPGVSFGFAATGLFPARVEKVALAAPRFRPHHPALLFVLLRHPWIIRPLFTTLRGGTGERIPVAIPQYGTSEWLAT